MRLECPFQNIATRVFKNRIFIQESVNRGDQTEIYRGEIRFFRKDSGRWPRSRNCSCRDNASNNANWFLVPFSRDDTLFIDTIWTRCSIYRVTISHENFIGKLGKRTWREGSTRVDPRVPSSLPLKGPFSRHTHTHTYTLSFTFKCNLPPLEAAFPLRLMELDDYLVSLPSSRINVLSCQMVGW